MEYGAVDDFSSDVAPESVVVDDVVSFFRYVRHFGWLIPFVDDQAIKQRVLWDHAAEMFQINGPGT